jgi:hypothetical protein
MQTLFKILKISSCSSSIYDLAPHDIKSVWSYLMKKLVDTVNLTSMGEIYIEIENNFQNKLPIECIRTPKKTDRCVKKQKPMCQDTTFSDR